MKRRGGDTVRGINQFTDRNNKISDFVSYDAAVASLYFRGSHEMEREMPTHTIDRDLPQVSEDAGRIYLNATQVRTRYGGISDMALWRWLQDNDLGFPQPIRINGRRFWLVSNLVAWECTFDGARAPGTGER